MRQIMKQQCIILGGFLILCSLLLPSSNVQANDDPTCSTVEECDALLGDLESELDDVTNDSDNLAQEQDDLQAERSKIQREIYSLNASIESLEQQQHTLSEKIVRQEEEINTTEVEIADMETRIYAIMRLNQRETYQNFVLDLFSENRSLADMMKSLRHYLHINQMNEELMTEFKALLLEQESRHNELSHDHDDLKDQEAKLLSSQQNLENKLVSLRELEMKIQEELQRLEVMQIETEEVMKLVQSQKETLVIPTNETFRIPLQHGYVTCEYGCYVDMNGILHNGIDLGNYGNTSTPIIASASGVVIRSGWHNGYGNHVILSHNLNGVTYTTVYAHMYTAPYVSLGEKVSAGQTLGTMGSTGYSSGPHLHFEIYEGYYSWPHSVNPRQYVIFPSHW